MPSGLCNYPDTANNKPCANPIGPGSTHCAAGHPVAHSTPAASPAAPLATEFGTIDLEELIGKPASSSTGKTSSELQPDRAEAAAGRLSAWLSQKVAFLGTEKGLRYRKGANEEVPFELDRLALGDEVLAFGDFGHPNGLYLERACRSAGCPDRAYVRIQNVSRWWRSGPIGKLEDRKASFQRSLDEARGVAPTCSAHRANRRKFLLPPRPPVPGDRGPEYEGRDLHAEGTWPTDPSDHKRSYGGVTFAPDGRVLLIEPRNHYNGYHWTFPKGGPGFDETTVETACRETVEETGMMAAVIGHVPGKFQGEVPAWTDKDGKKHEAHMGSANYYYLMCDSGDRHPEIMNNETYRCVWATPDEARVLIGQSTNKNGRQRDLDVLKAAIAAHEALLAGAAS